MRKIPAALAVLGLTSLGLTGCAIPAGYEDCSRPASESTAAGLVTVTGEVGKKPQVTVPSPFHVDTTSFEDLEVGDGTAITAPGQLIVVDFSIFDGSTGEEVYAYSDGALAPATFGHWSTLIPGFEKALSCATEGTRVVVALPPGGIEPESAAGLGLSEDDSAVAVVDVKKVYLPRAQGSLVYNDAQGMPTVVRAPDGRPGIIVPDADAPTDVVVQTLIKGEGEKVDGKRPVRIAFTGVGWDDRKVFNTTWDSEPSSVPLEGQTDAVSKALKNATVGSQLLVVTPATPASGDSSTAEPARVFVIDILGFDEAAQ